MNIGNLFSTDAEPPQDLLPTNLEDLLLCNDHEFIECAYKLILMRSADAGGLQFYLARLRSGVGKLQILGELSTSDEARMRGALLKGLSSRLKLQQLESVPVLGPIFGFLSRVAGDSKATVRRKAIARETLALGNALSRVIHREKQLESEQLLFRHRQEAFEAQQSMFRQSLEDACRRQGAFEAQQSMFRQSLEDACRRQEAFEKQQLPALIQTLSDLNQRQLANDNDHDNLCKSVPVALRKITRDAVEMRSTYETLSRTIERQLAQIEAAPQLKMLMGDVGYLLGRVEFVRRELMFEMRYGTSTTANVPDRLNVDPVIATPENLEIARKNGVRLNLGCGHVPLSGYLNVDRRALPGVDIIAEVDRLPFEKNEVEEIFSAHLIGHFPLEQLRRNLLAYWFELLRPGGLFRAVASDAQAMIAAYFAKEYPFERLREVTFGGQDSGGDFHYNMLTTESFAELLSEAGFTDIRVIAENRVNGACRKFELTARRPYKES